MRESIFHLPSYVPVFGRSSYRAALGFGIEIVRGCRWVTRPAQCSVVFCASLIVEVPGELY